MRYRVQHITTYTYDDDVTGSYGQFHLRPRDLDWQRCLAHEVTVDPGASTSTGTSTCTATPSPTSTSRPRTPSWWSPRPQLVEVDPPRYDAGGAGPALGGREAAGAGHGGRAGPGRVAGDRLPVRLHPGGHPAGDPGVHGAVLHARAGRSARPPIELMHRVYADFTYKSGSTTVTTRVAELLENKTGVCQDFTHFMVSGLRSLGLAGRYVSGYLATRPPPGKPRLVGADAVARLGGLLGPGQRLDVSGPDQQPADRRLPRHSGLGS